MNTEHKRNLQRAADFCREMKHDALAEACSRASAHIVELERAEAERDALKADAVRYRWLRERLSHQHCGPHCGWGTDQLIPGDDPDAAIDAALAGRE